MYISKYALYISRRRLQADRYTGDVRVNKKRSWKWKDTDTEREVNITGWSRV